ncbi:hypothetical protein SAY87_003835 [Trapa incisa]|uniref:cytokinin riboside 5'-monophosphate phosphoribohydrolase n=1 Tax=Trapa incisa TaxID=236973 RepID=A0AAN7QIG4_9MYRT|nr:hypothetical protein SAY87_003835 [Trapa incisa]
MVKQTSRFRRVCVFCGSSSGNRPSYQLAALQLAKQLVERNIDLVYGGGSIGLMGLISQAVFNGGRHVLGVIPKTLMPREVRLLLRLLLLLLFLLLLLLLLQITGETVGEVRAVSSMHQRKAEMAQQSDAFIALPGTCLTPPLYPELNFSLREEYVYNYLGGYGTLEELLEVISWSQLGIHDKPVGLLNVDGYYNSLLSFIDKAVDEGFVTPSARHIFVSAPTAHELISKLEEYAPEHCGVASKLSWEMERQIVCDTMLEIGR